METQKMSKPDNIEEKILYQFDSVVLIAWQICWIGKQYLKIAHISF